MSGKFQASIIKLESWRKPEVEMAWDEKYLWISRLKNSDKALLYFSNNLENSIYLLTIVVMQFQLKGK